MKSLFITFYFSQARIFNLSVFDDTQKSTHLFRLSNSIVTVAQTVVMLEDNCSVSC